MDFRGHLAFIRSRWLLLAAILALLVWIHLLRVTERPETTYRAISDVIIYPDPLSARAGSLLPLPPYYSFGTKLGTITDLPVLRRAARLAYGKLPFRSKPFLNQDSQEFIRQQIEALRDRFGGDEDAIVALLRRSVLLKQIPKTQVVRVRAEADDGQNARFLTWIVTEAAYQYHEERAREGFNELLDNITTMCAQTQETADDAELELAKVQTRSGVYSVSLLNEWEQKILSRTLALEERLSELTVQIRENEFDAHEFFLKHALRPPRDTVETMLLSDSSDYRELRDKSSRARIDVEILAESLTRKHPEVVLAEARLAGLERRISARKTALWSEYDQAVAQKAQVFLRKSELLSLDWEVVKEHKEELEKNLRSLSAVREDLGRAEKTTKATRRRLNTLKKLELELGWLAGSALGAVHVHSPAISSYAFVPKRGSIAALALTIFMTIVFSVGVVYVAEYVDFRVRNPHDVRSNLGRPLLGTIRNQRRLPEQLLDSQPGDEVIEMFGTAATLVRQACQKTGAKSLLVCSAIPREGKTTVALNLSKALARKGLRVLLVDGDLRIPQIHTQLHLPNDVGASTVMGAVTGSTPASDPISFIQTSPIENLDVLTSGPSCNDPTKLYNSQRIIAFLRQLRRHYDFVIVDTPPLNRVGDALSFSHAVDTAIFVVGASQVKQSEVAWARHLLNNVNLSILGVFLNDYAHRVQKSRHEEMQEGEVVIE